MKADASKSINDANQENRHSKGRDIYFIVGFYKIRREILHIIIGIISGANSIKLTHNKIPFHRFLNLGELIQGYLVSKLRKA